MESDHHGMEDNVDAMELSDSDSDFEFYQLQCQAYHQHMRNNVVTSAILFEKLAQSSNTPQYGLMSPTLEKMVREATHKFDTMRPFLKEDQAEELMSLGDELDNEYAAIFEHLTRYNPVKRGSLHQLIADFGMFRCAS